MNFTLDSASNIDGTYFHDVTISVSYDTLIKVLGEPHFENDPSDKSRYEWFFTSDDGKPATLYDWKVYSSNPKIWHVGALDKNTAVSFKNWLYSKV